jgi:hypothetical protein
MKAKHYVDSPRIEVMLVPDGERDDINSDASLFDIWLVLHSPDGKAPTTVRLDGGPYNRGGAVEILCEVWKSISMEFGDPRTTGSLFSAPH